MPSIPSIPIPEQSQKNAPLDEIIQNVTVTLEHYLTWRTLPPPPPPKKKKKTQISLITFTSPLHLTALSLLVFNNQAWFGAVGRFRWDTRTFCHSSDAIFASHHTSTQFATPLFVISQCEISVLAVETCNILKLKNNISFPA